MELQASYFIANSWTRFWGDHKKIINGFDLEMTDLHVILSLFPLQKLKKFIICYSINKHRPLALWENNSICIPPQTQKGIQGFDNELSDLHPILSPLSLQKI